MIIQLSALLQGEERQVIKHVVTATIKRLQRELLFGVEVEEGSQLDAPEIVL